MLCEKCTHVRHQNTLLVAIQPDWFLRRLSWRHLLGESGGFKGARDSTRRGFTPNLSFFFLIFLPLPFLSFDFCGFGSFLQGFVCTETQSRLWPLNLHDVSAGSTDDSLELGLASAQSLGHHQRYVMEAVRQSVRQLD